MFERSINACIKEFLPEKYVLLSGPRQVGKTTLARSLAHNFTYLNFDASEHRLIIMNKQWPRNGKLLILDELHKMKSWKRWLKGLYDIEKTKIPVIVTGSARLDTYNKGGDSLAGRHQFFHLMPLSIKEIDPTRSEEVFELLLRFGGFPEPFIKASERSAKLWRKGHLDVVLRQDLLDLEKVRDIKSIEILVDLLADKVGSTLSYSSLAATLEVSPHTVKHWIQILENLYVIFVLKPYSKDIAKSILKEPKIYFYDTGRVTAGDAAKLENLVACHLLKRAHFIRDTQGDRTDLFYIKDKEKREIDFVTVKNKKVEWLIEVKQSDEAFTTQVYYYHKRLLPEKTFQLIRNIKNPKSTADGMESIGVAKFLGGLET